ncbi:MAG: anthranilate phosphoribosyltransferase family protein [Cyanobacteria bacterium P01_F01_bin.3]
MSDEFRTLLKTVGSGPRTAKNLNRPQAKRALHLMLTNGATPAQIGAFFIAHRIKRPTGEELAGFLDTFEALGPQISELEGTTPAVVLSNPYDGRSRTAPLSALTSLLLATVGVPVLTHGSDSMPTKYGIPLLEVWQLLGVDWRGLSIPRVTAILQSQKVGFLYMGDHFPQFQTLIPYRDQVGKRPPLATAELLWCPYQGDARLVSGYVHPPTEKMLKTAFHCRQRERYTTIKGLEGSVDLPRDRAAIIGVHHPGQEPLERHLLHARDYNLGGPEMVYESPERLSEEMHQLLNGEPSSLMPGVLWNGGFYLWHFGPCESLQDGIKLTEVYIREGKLKQTLARLQAAIAA